MTHRKKSVMNPSSDEIKRYTVSAAKIPASSLEANATPSSADAAPDTTSSQLDSDARSGSHFTEQRRARRFPVCSHATIRWLGSDGVVHEALGVVRDISTCGLFVETPLSLRTNTNVELEIAPFGVQPESPKTELHFEGKIVRTERAARRGFAVAGFLWLAKLGLRIS